MPRWMRRTLHMQWPVCGALALALAGASTACVPNLLPEDRARPEYEECVRCHRCVDEYSEADRARFRERQRQVELATARGALHLGRREDAR